MFEQDVSAPLPVGYWKSLVWPSLCSLLAKEGYRRWEDDAIIAVISPLAPRSIVERITFVVVAPVRLFPVAACLPRTARSGGYRSPTLCNTIGRDKFEANECDTPSSPEC